MGVATAFKMLCLSGASQNNWDEKKARAGANMKVSTAHTYYSQKPVTNITNYILYACIECECDFPYTVFNNIGSSVMFNWFEMTGE